jgi:hypothetical protein
MQELTFSTFENSNSNIKIDYPSNWIYKENSVSDIEFHPPAKQLQATQGPPTEQSSAIIRLTVTPLQSNVLQSIPL